MTTSHSSRPVGVPVGTTDPAEGPSPAHPPVPPGVPRTSGLAELIVPAILVAVAGFLIVGTVSMQLPPSVQVPGPTFFPIVVIVLLLGMAVLSTVQILRSRRTVAATAELGDANVDMDGEAIVETPPDVPPGREPWPPRAVSDWRALLTVLGSLVAFIVLLRPAGWIIAAALLFWGVSYALGSRRPIFDISVALVMSSAIQLIFGVALGLNLPAGFLQGVL
ncbi:tripartite tricarboxylate transporter TctB family protein [Nakamurella flavida]|uniref:Tripartite tricarboxylate transporter TctB family protein n=1 Tax=Nakamurella flavida TaxID=363630 RepID=A0A938YMD4_9ACTN|nr:tripartite tricarboxylate transporter TctB family protein [Nakamurella flavida]MBM9477894.1 tripartite tricarboxylate transporter TctB family protein [Nakamurella flavida]MDP9778392.1 putative tricarboxylic transport membrane protein [Nakamurella flavida]